MAFLICFWAFFWGEFKKLNHFGRCQPAGILENRFGFLWYKLTNLKLYYLVTLIALIMLRSRSLQYSIEQEIDCRVKDDQTVGNSMDMKQPIG